MKKNNYIELINENQLIRLNVVENIPKEQKVLAQNSQRDMWHSVVLFTKALGYLIFKFVKFLGEAEKILSIEIRNSN